ncbi:MAG: ScpA family protein [Rhodospirillales bacterium]|nr:ScpA family protein [Rhodospirillales bacterium]
MNAPVLEFEEDPPPPRAAPDAFFLSLDAYEGPIDLLLTLARRQKVDLAEISILELAEQYLAFVEGARRLNLEVAAGHLVTAAWLAYMKSRLLLPESEEEQLTGEELAEALRFRIVRLDAMRRHGELLFRRPLLGRDRHARGETRPRAEKVETAVDATFHDLIVAYAGICRRRQPPPLAVRPKRLYSVKTATGWIRNRLAGLQQWATLAGFLPRDDPSPVRRSAYASVFVASLELVRGGELDMRQARPFGPVLVRSRAGPNGDPAHAA